MTPPLTREEFAADVTLARMIAAGWVPPDIYGRFAAPMDRIARHDAAQRAELDATRAKLAEATTINRTLIAGLRHRPCENRQGELRCSSMVESDAGFCMPCFARLFDPDRAP